VSKVGQNFGALDPVEGEIFWGNKIFYPLLWYLYAREFEHQTWSTKVRKVDFTALKWLT